MTSNILNQRYTNLVEIGSGGMGTVYCADDSQTNSPVAIKHLRKDAINHNPDILERFRREGEALRDLDHPNIVKMLDTFSDGDEHYLVMEFVDGANLSQILNDGELSIKKILNIAIDIADALTRAHRLNIIHRDIKPANILIAEDGRVKLTDFGVAFIGEKSKITENNMVIGTLNYLSPEACNGKQLDVRTDVWSFGVVLFEMLTGDTPFSGDNMGAIIASILSKPLPDLEQYRDEIPVSLIDLIYRMVEKDVQQRIPSVRIVGAELESILKGNSFIEKNNADQATRDGATIVATTDAQLKANRFATTPSHYKTSEIKNNLPAETSAFVGRDAELAELKRLLEVEHNRLVTIVAPGGMGKTRLAIEYGRAHLADYPDGVYMVELAPLDSPEGILPAIAEALSIKLSEQAPPLAQLFNEIADKHMLIIMDNFEHVINGAPLLQDVLKGAPQINMIATSREKLNLSSETVFQLAGMDFPDWETPENALEYAAVRLFMQSATRVQPSFTLEANDLAYIARICRLSQGLPLGILLAASWVEMLPVSEIADELSQSVDFLETEMRDIPERQRSIRAVFEYSWDLLTDKERETIASLSIFRGGFARQAAQRITGASLRALTTLVNKSLLSRDPASGRYSVHELLRQYAYEKLQDAGIENEIRQAHGEFYLMEMDYDWSFLAKPLIASQRFDAESENYRIAWEWAVDNRQFEIIKPMIFSLDAFGFALNKFFKTSSWLDYARTQWNIFEKPLEELEQLERMVAYRQLSTRMPEAIKYIDHSVAEARKIEDDTELSHALMAKGITLSAFMQRPEEAIGVLEESIESFRRLDELSIVAQQMLYRAYIIAGNYNLAYENILRDIDPHLNLPPIYVGQLKTYLAIMLGNEAHMRVSHVDKAHETLLDTLRFYERIENPDDAAVMRIFSFYHAILTQNESLAAQCLQEVEHYAEVNRSARTDAFEDTIGASLIDEIRACYALYKGNIDEASNVIHDSVLTLQGFYVSRNEYLQSITTLVANNPARSRDALRNFIHTSLASLLRIKDDQVVPIQTDTEPADAPLYAMGMPVIVAEMARQLGQVEIAAQIYGNYLNSPIDMRYFIEDMDVFTTLPDNLEADMGAEAYQKAINDSQESDLSTLYTAVLVSDDD